MPKLFQQTGGGSLPRRTKMNLSHEKRMSAEFFYLYPTLALEVLPGDHIQLGCDLVTRTQPLATPLMHEINHYIHSYFVPIRILDENFENSITGGRDGKFQEKFKYIPSTQLWTDMTSSPNNVSPNIFRVGGLMDYLYNVCDANTRFTEFTGPERWTIPVLAYKLAAYNMIWNEYYRDQNLEPKAPLYDLTNIVNGDYTTGIATLINDLDPDNYPPEIPPPAKINISRHKGLFARAWEKDYFTSALPWQQRGDAPALPLHGIGSTIFTGQVFGPAPGQLQQYSVLSINHQLPGNPDAVAGSPVVPDGVENHLGSAFNDGGAMFRDWLNQNQFDMANIATSADVNDMRWLFQLQRYMEKTARGGARYTEWLKQIYNDYPTDERLDRPEYIGGIKTPLIISEVLQTSATQSDSPQGNLAGHGISVDRGYIGSYRVKEHGYIINLLSIMPKPIYSQGLDRKDCKQTRFDYYMPVFDQLSEQAILTPSEVHGIATSANAANSPETWRIFGYQGHWDEYRYEKSLVHGEMRTWWENWHMARKFNQSTYLNSSYIRPYKAEIQSLKRAFTSLIDDPFYITLVNRIHATRSMSYMSIPGRIDHN